MHIKKLFRIFLISVAFMAAPHKLPAAGADAILGIWIPADGGARIQIYRCGVLYCGKISHLEDPYYPPHDRRGMGGLPRMDRNNPDPELRHRPMLGLTFLEDFRYAGDDSWEGGRIYNPENGKFYRAKITLADQNRLMLRGYLGISLLGRTETWVRWEEGGNPDA